MKIYKTEKILNFSGGLIGLSRDQAKVRSHLLKKVKKGVYHILGKVVFKAGEKIGLDNPDKSISRFLCDEESRMNVDSQSPIKKGKGARNKVNMEELIKAMFDLEEGNPDHFTKNKLPRVGVVTKIVGFEVTAGQCNEAWSEFQKG
jgi:hypothetical protein